MKRHTRRLANADLDEGCLDIYHELQRHGQDQGLDALMAPLRERFKARRMVVKDEEPVPTERESGLWESRRAT